MSKRPSLAETMRQAASAPDSAPIAAPPLQLSPPPLAPREHGFYAATRVGKKKVTATLAPADHKRLRQLALERDATTEALLAEAISDLFAKYGKGAVGQGTGAS
jgi:hypothetical protein